MPKKYWHMLLVINNYFLFSPFSMPKPKRSTKKTVQNSTSDVPSKKKSSSVLGDDMTEVMDSSCDNCECSPKRSSAGLIIAIIFATAVISGSLVFFGMQTGASWWPLNSEVKSSDSEFDQRVEAAIEKYVQKKQAEQQAAQAKSADQEVEQSKEKAKAVAPVSKTNDHIYGNPDAQISLVEYSDFQCPFCKRFHPTAKQIVDSSNGEVNWIYRNFPLEGHEPEATQQALAAECVAELAGNDAYWQYADILFSKGTSDVKGMTEEAVKLGANESEFKQCYESQKHKDRIQSNMENGIKAGVSGTPGNILLNNKTGEAVLIEGAQSATVFSRYIEKLKGN